MSHYRGRSPYSCACGPRSGVKEDVEGSGLEGDETESSDLAEDKGGEEGVCHGGGGGRGGAGGGSEEEH